MAKTKTSQKPASFSFDEMETAQVKNAGAAYSPTAKLRDREFIALAIFDALLQGDLIAFKEIIKSHYEALNIDETLKRVNLSKRTFYEAISQKGNPSLETISKIIRGIGKKGITKVPTKKAS